MPTKKGQRIFLRWPSVLSDILFCESSVPAAKPNRLFGIHFLGFSNPSFRDAKNRATARFFAQIFFWFSLDGGGEWIRTTEVVDNRFTVCPLWPLGNSPINYAILYKACPAFLLGRTAQFGAGERTRTPDLLITNSVRSVHLEVSSDF